MNGRKEALWGQHALIGKPEKRAMLANDVLDKPRHCGLITAGVPPRILSSAERPGQGSSPIPPPHEQLNILVVRRTHHPITP